MAEPPRNSPVVENWKFVISFPSADSCIEDHHKYPDALPFLTDKKGTKEHHDSLLDADVQITVTQPNFASDPDVERKFWDGLEKAAEFIGTLTANKTIAIDHLSYGNNIHADLRCEAIVLRQARRITELRLGIDDEFQDVSHVDDFASALSSHSCLETWRLVDPLLDLLEVAGSSQILTRALLSLPKLSIFPLEYYKIFDPDQLGNLVCRPAMRRMEFHACDVAKWNEFFAGLATERTSVQSLEIFDTFRPFDDEDGNGQLAEKLVNALNTNRSLQTLKLMPPPSDEDDELNDADEGAIQRQREAGRLLGEALARHPALENFALHFAWHKTFSLNVLATLSTSQRLQDLSLYKFEGTPEQCIYLLPVLQNMQLSQLVITGVEHADGVLATLAQARSTNLRILSLHVSESVNSAQFLLLELGKLIESNLNSLKELSVPCFDTLCTFSDYISFLSAVKESQLSSLDLDFFIPSDDADICANSLIHAIKGSFNLMSFNINPLRRLAGKEIFPLLSLESIAACQGLLDMNRAGRRYILIDPLNKAQGIDVLASAHDKLDCLFLHLLENPFLCSAVHRK